MKKIYILHYRLSEKDRKEISEQLHYSLSPHLDYFDETELKAYNTLSNGEKVLTVNMYNRISNVLKKGIKIISEKREYYINIKAIDENNYSSIIVNGATYIKALMQTYDQQLAGLYKIMDIMDIKDTVIKEVYEG